MRRRERESERERTADACDQFSSVVLQPVVVVVVVVVVVSLKYLILGVTIRM